MSEPLSGTPSREEGYERFRRYLEETSGILLGANRQYLVDSRLGRLLREEGIASLGELVERMAATGGRALRQSVIDAMVTNETLWFRDHYPFQLLRERLLPELMEQGRGALRIWSAACSSGQEPYSISMVVEEYRQASMGVLRRPVEIVATDLSRSMIEVAEQGIYDRMSLARGIRPEQLQRHFEPMADGRHRVRDSIRQRVRFRQLNLLDSLLSLGRLDLVFCRNVLIYFSAERKQDILRRIHASMVPGGYLLLGGSEVPTGVADCFEMVHCSPGIVYRAR